MRQFIKLSKQVRFALPCTTKKKLRYLVGTFLNSYVKFSKNVPGYELIPPWEK